MGAIERLGNEFLTTNVRLNASGEARASAFANLSAQVDTLLSDGTFTPALERFFNALQDVNNDPSSTPARLVFLNAAETLTDRFQDLESRLSTLAQNVNQDIAAKVGKLNSMAQSWARSTAKSSSRSASARARGRTICSISAIGC